MIPLNVFICIIVAQCLYNLFCIWLLSNENKQKDKVIAKLSSELDDKNALARIYKHLWEAKENEKHD